jgi:hypothetical protein
MRRAGSGRAAQAPKLPPAETLLDVEALQRLPLLERHKALACAYAARNQASEAHSVGRTYRFLRTSEDDESVPAWAAQLAQTYYAKLYREYALADLSKAEIGKLGLRWRTEREVLQGRGQFACGVLGCVAESELQTFEVPFRYKEAGESKLALVKLRCCRACAPRLQRARGDEGSERGRGVGSRQRSRSRSPPERGS